MKTKGKANHIDVFVGKKIREARALRGYSQEDLAKAVDKTFQQIQKYENGTNRVSASVLYEFTEVLQFDFAYFFPSKKPIKTEGLMLKNMLEDLKESTRLMNQVTKLIRKLNTEK